MSIITKMKFSRSLDSENSIQYITNVLDDDEQLGLQSLLLINELKQPTVSIYGNRPKFYGTTFNHGTAPSKHYSQRPMTPMASNFSKLIKDRYDQHFPNTFSKHYNCNLSYYSPDLANGGSRGKHQDNVKNIQLALVLVYSYGQDRQFSIFKDNKKILSVTLKENSILAMRGVTFQKTYFHQLDKLKKGVVAEDRVSFNTRYYI